MPTFWKSLRSEHACRKLTKFLNMCACVFIGDSSVVSIIDLADASLLQKRLVL